MKDGIVSFNAFDFQGELSVQLFDVSGKRIYHQRVSGNTTHYLSDLNKGIYIYTVTNAQNNVLLQSGKIGN